MQQSSVNYYHYGMFNQDSGGAATHSPWIPDTTKTNQYPPQWGDSNGGFPLTSGNSYGAGQVSTGGGQNRVPGVPQQNQTQQQPPPTSTPPGIHDMSKQPLMQNQAAQMSYVQTRIPPNTPNFAAAAAFPRGAMNPTPAIRSTHGRGPLVTNPLYQPIQGVLTSAGPTQTIVQTLQFPVMTYGQPRQNAPYAPQGQYVMSQPYFAGPTQNAYYPVISAGPAAYPGLSSGGPSPQAASQGSVQIIRPSMMPNTGSMVAPPSGKPETKKRPNAIKIINPDSLEEVMIDNENSSNNNNVTPTRSNESSARQTPQPNSGVIMDNTVAADFAARVAAVAAGEPTIPAQPPPDQPRPPEHSAPSEQSVVVPSSDKVLNTVLNTSSEEFVPRSHKVLVQPTEPPVEEQHVPTVSAETNSPAIEIQRSKEFPTLKNQPVAQSPARSNTKKQKSSEPLPPPQSQPTVSDIKEKVMPARGGGLKKNENAPLTKVTTEGPRSVSKRKSPAPGLTEIVSSQAETAPAIPSVPSKGEDAVKNNSALTHTSAEELLNNKTAQHQNGETAVPEPPPPVTVDSSKTSRPKNKKSSNKMRSELNRKGVEKEGSDMDAFTTEPTIVSEEKERPETPASPTPPPTIEASVPAVLVDKIKEDLEEKEDKQEKLVAAKNEENAKVSALSKAEEETSDPPVIEKIEEKKPTPQLTLRHSYKKDQWSPLNPEGKKKYERDFLMTLKDDIQSKKMPENLPDVVAVIRDSSNNMRYNQNMNFLNRGGDVQKMLPDFIRGTQSQRGPILKGSRGSQQGNKGKGNPKMIHVSISLHDDVKLKTTENAWKPARLESEAGKSEEEKGTERLLKEVRGILNKLTPQKFDTLMKKFQQLPINSEHRLISVINLIFEKAVDEPNFSKAYANMCKLCSKLEVTKIENDVEQRVNFRKLLITRCQHEFEKNKSCELDAAKWLEEIKNCTDPEQKKELQLSYEEKERQIRMKSVGNIRFIGELFKLEMLTSAIMYRCIEHLLNNPDEEKLECLCKLLTTIGKELEFGKQNQKQTVSLNPYFQRMYELSQKREGSKISSRVRFMLQDVIELRQNKWVPRREDNNPKTIEQINKEAEREAMDMTIALQQQPPRMNRQNDRQDDRKRGNRAGNNLSEDGWVSVPTTARYHHSKFNTAFEASKMANIVKNEVDLNSVSLGGRHQFIFQNAATKNMENKTGQSTFTSNNTYSVLRDDKKPPPQPNMNRRLTPTPSIEKDKERQRMMQGLDNEGRNSRGSSLQRERPQTTSRDSSLTRPAPSDNKEVDRKEDKKVDEKALRLSEEKLERQIQTIYDEYLAKLASVEDVKQDVEQICDDSHKLGTFFARGMEMSMERKNIQKDIAQLIVALLDCDLLSCNIIVEQLMLTYENAEDIAIDVPKVWELQAQVIVPIIAAEKMNFNHFKAACSPVLQTKPAVKLLLPVLKFLEAEKGPGFVRKVWDSSNVSLTDFLPSDINIDAFIKENSLEYLTGEPPKYSAEQLPMEQVKEKMYKLMISNTPCDKIFEFISSNVGDNVESLQFIRALITAICEACITEGPNYTIDHGRFKEYEKLIQRYVDNKEDRELVCLGSVHNLIGRLEHPQGLIMTIFNLFLDNSLISSDSFLKWKDDDTEKLENKGVSLFALASFFQALEEAESDDENS